MRKFVLVTWLLLCVVLTYSQTNVISGKITTDEGTPIPFATISIKGTRTGTSASQDGTFRINAKSGDVLVITSQGYAPREITVGDSRVVNATLSIRTADLAEVIVSAGYNSRRTQRSTVSNAQVVSNEQLTTIRQTNL